MKLKKDEVVWLLIFIAPAIGLFFLFFILPILFLFVTSFTNWDGIGAEFVGLEDYSKLLNKYKNKNNKLLTRAFQRRFRQDLINGIIDQECLLISKNLTKNIK